MKKICINSKCVCCGTCASMSKYIKENDDGTVCVVNSGMISDNEISDFNEIIKLCPVNAISLKDAGNTNKTGIEGLKEIREKIQKEFDNYKIELPSYTYEFKAKDYFIPIPYSSNQHKYEYKSDSKATAAGLKEFDRIMYSQRKALIQQVLVQYKTALLSNFTEYVEEDGNFYYDINKKLLNKLSEYITEINNISQEPLKIPSDYLSKKVMPQFGIKGDKIDRELFVYQIRNLEKLDLVDTIVNDIPGLYDYELYVNTDDMEDYRGKYMYSYDLLEVCEELSNDIRSNISIEINSEIRDIVEGNLKTVIKKMEQDIKNKINELIISIDKIIKKNN